MAQTSYIKTNAGRFRRLAVESLQSRLVFAGALHAYLDMGQLDYGQTVADVGIGATGEIRVLGDGFYAGGKVWDFDSTGNLIKQQSVGALAGRGVLLHLMRFRQMVVGWGRSTAKFRLLL